MTERERGGISATDGTARVVRVGDVLRFSTALLENIHAQPAHQSVAVQVQDVLQEPDGTKTLVLMHREAREPKPHPADRGSWFDRIIRKEGTHADDADDTAPGSGHDAARDLPDRRGRSGEGR